VHIWKMIKALILSSAFIGCTPYNKTPHQNFVDNLVHGTVGTDIRQQAEYSKFKQSPLPDGNVEFSLTRRYLPERNLCTLIYEVNSKTHRIIRADWEGSERDCILLL
jgi:hypothetical protein